MINFSNEKQAKNSYRLFKILKSLLFNIDQFIIDVTKAIFLSLISQGR